MIEQAEREQADVVCASRYMRGGCQIGGPFLKGLMSRCAGLSLCTLVNFPTHDPTNSFKLYRKSFINKMKIESKGGFELGFELVVKAWKKGYKVCEVPTSWKDRTNGDSKFKLLKWLPHYLRWYFIALTGQKEQRFEPGKITRFGGVVLFLLFLFMHIPELVILEREETWVTLLHLARKYDLRFGHDLIFTYGPLGYLLFPAEPSQMLISSLFALALLLPFCIFFIRKLSFSDLFFLSVFTVISTSCRAYDIFTFFLPMLFWRIAEEKNPWSRYGWLMYSSILAGICVFIKFMGVPIILFSLLTADIFLLKRKKIIWATPFFLLSLPLIWCFPACQELSSLYHFFIYSWQIAVGYNYSMFLSESSPLWFLIFAGGAFFVFILSFFTDTKQKTYDSAIEKFLYSTLVLPNLFVICKYGVVRADVQHIYFALQYLALTAVFCSMYFCGMHGKWRFCLFSLSLLLMLVSIKIQGALFYRMEYYATVSAVFAAILLIFVLLKYDFFTVLSRSILLLFLSIGIVLLLYSICLPWKSQWKGAVVRQQKALLFSDITTRPLKTADYFSFEILPFIDKAKYRPRMVIQSYSAYTPMLLRKNASCFEYASGPDLIYYDRQAIDSILPSFHDSLALLHIINNYEVGPYKKQLRKKSICPPKAHLREVKMFCSEMNKIIHLPQQKQFLWMSIDFQCTLIGKILKYALRPSEVKIKLVLDNGKKLVHKIIPENAIVPFLISPYMSEWDQLGNLLDKNNAALPKVVSCSVYPVFHCFSHYFDLENWDSKIGELSYHKTITVRFFQQEHFVEKTESHL